ncbi:KptA family-domain-containing protein [Mycena floridula]|nr:KptA family-domain-containing protein [Mycena floridula]
MRRTLFVLFSSTKMNPKRPPVQRPPKKANDSSGKLRGLPRDAPEVRLSKTLSWLLRHGAQSQGLPMRADGYVKVTDLLASPKLKDQPLDLVGLQAIVEADSKQRYSLISEDSEPGHEATWWIKANQGHSIKTVELVMKRITAVSDIPSGFAVHGTSLKAWDSIRQQGLSKMTRNHIHLAQGVAGDNVISGMRRSSQVLIYINVQKALDAGVEFFLSDNGVVLTVGDETGFLGPQYFDKVENAKHEALTGWR